MTVQQPTLKGAILPVSRIHVSRIFVAFGEVWASDLTKCLAENPQIVVVEGLSLASGEMFGSNLTKCPKLG